MAVAKSKIFVCDLRFENGDTDLRWYDITTLAPPREYELMMAVGASLVNHPGGRRLTSMTVYQADATEHNRLEWLQESGCTYYFEPAFDPTDLMTNLD